MSDSKITISKDEHDALIADKEFLDFLDSKGGKWVARDSFTGRGYRVHQSDSLGAHATARAAIADAMKQSEGPEEPVTMADGKIQSFIPQIAGKGFRCDCGCNVFHKPNKKKPSIYQCNACGTRFNSA